MSVPAFKIVKCPEVAGTDQRVWSCVCVWGGGGREGKGNIKMSISVFPAAINITQLVPSSKNIYLQLRKFKKILNFSWPTSSSRMHIQCTTASPPYEVFILRREKNRRTLRTRRKSPRSAGKTNYNSTHISSKFDNQHETIPRWSPIQL